MSRFPSGGLTLAYDDIRPARGEIGAAVLVHGFAANRAENWRRLGWFGAFERAGYRVTALDLRGHGDSDKPHDPAAYDASAMAGDVIALMDHLQLHRAHLIGYSFGARLAIAAALAAPGRIDHLVLGGVGDRLLNPRPAAEGAMTMGQAMRADDPATVTAPTLRGFRRFADSQGDDRLALAACAEARRGPVTAADLANLRAPTLVAAGARDTIAGDPAALAAAVPGAKSVALAACDHFSAISHALFKAAVFDFLEGWED